MMYDEFHSRMRLDEGSCGIVFRYEEIVTRYGKGRNWETNRDKAGTRMKSERNKIRVVARVENPVQLVADLGTSGR